MIINTLMSKSEINKKELPLIIRFGEIEKIDSVFDIYVVEMYSWLLVPPDPELIEQQHVDNKLNEIIGSHRESQLKAKAYFDERKRDLTENIEIENVEEEVTNDSAVSAESPSGVPTDSSLLGHCPNSGPDTEEGVSPSELMDAMVNENLKEID